jgi:hypothetical protein
LARLEVVPFPLVPFLVGVLREKRVPKNSFPMVRR